MCFLGAFDHIETPLKFLSTLLYNNDRYNAIIKMNQSLNVDIPVEDCKFLSVIELVHLGTFGYMAKDLDALKHASKEVVDFLRKLAREVLLVAA